MPINTKGFYVSGHRWEWKLQETEGKCVIKVN